MDDSFQVALTGPSGVIDQEQGNALADRPRLVLPRFPGQDEQPVTRIEPLAPPFEVQLENALQHHTSSTNARENSSSRTRFPSRSNILCRAPCAMAVHSSAEKASL
jgi:hypothetical protein